MCKLLVVIAAIGAIVWSGAALAIVDETSVSVNNTGNELNGATVSLTTTDGKTVKTETGHPGGQPRKAVKQTLRTGTQGQAGSDKAIEGVLGTAIGIGFGLGLHGGFGRGGGAERGGLLGGDRGTLRGGDRGGFHGGARRD